MNNQNQLEFQTMNYLNRYDEILRIMSNQMLHLPITNNISLDFINSMIPHQQAAIYMCENLLEYTTNMYLRDLALRIIKISRKNIDEMLNIRRTIKPQINRPEDVNRYVSKYLSITNNMINKMRNSHRTPNIGINFIGAMIPHHEGAVLLCQNVLQYQIDPRLRILALAMIEELNGEIQQLNSIKNTILNKNISRYY